MPGLVGAVSLHGEPVDGRVIAAMRDALVHRSWYHVQDWRSNNDRVAIARVHLGVPGPQAQPGLVARAGGQLVVFLHGEIYNDDAVNDPLSFIAALYEKHGPDFVARLKGAFVIVLVDEATDTVLLANDRLGARPMFYVQDAHALYFAPEIKSLLQLPTVSKQLFGPAVADFLANGHFTTAHTWIKGIVRQDSATVLAVQAGRVTTKRYWTFTFHRDGPDLGAERYRARLGDLARQAVRRCVRDEHRYGILLSGGYDSRGILGCYLEARGDEPLYTVSWGRDENIAGSDCAVAQRLAQQLGANHGYYRLAAGEILNNFQEAVWLGEGLTDFLESYAVFDRIRARQGVEVVLRGDECFGYSHWTTVHDELGMFRALDLRTMRFMPDYRLILKPVWFDRFCAWDMETRRQLSARCSARQIHNRKDFFYLDVRIQYYLNPLNYVKTFAIESYRPWLDYDILDLMMVLPLKYRLGKRFWRDSISHMFPELYAEMAQHHNMILWPTALKSSPETVSWVYRELLETTSVLDEFVNREALKTKLDAFFASQAAGPSTGLARISGRLNEKTRFYHWLHTGVYYARKWSGRINHALATDRLILRLLILKTWGDLFL